MNSGDRRQASNQIAEEEYMKHVQHLTLTCLRRLMSLPETEVYLAVYYEIQPEITRRAWRRLEEQFRDFFFWYNMRCGFHISISRTMHQYRLDMMELNRPANQDHLQPALNTPSSCMSPVPQPCDLFAIKRDDPAGRHQLNRYRELTRRYEGFLLPFSYSSQTQPRKMKIFAKSLSWFSATCSSAAMFLNSFTGSAARIAAQNMGYVDRFASLFHRKVKRNKQQQPQRQGLRPNHQQRHHRIQQQQQQRQQHGPGPSHPEMAVSEVIHDEAPSPSKYEGGSDSSSEMTSAPRKRIRLQ